MDMDSIEHPVGKVKEYSAIDIVIPTYKPGATFERLIDGLLRQTVQPNHIFVINTEQAYFDDEKYKNIENMTIQHIKKEEFDHGGTRNYGATLSKTPYIMFMTDDAVPADEYLIEEILKGFEKENVAAVYGRQLPRENAGVIEAYTRKFNYPENDQLKSVKDKEVLGIKTYFCSNVCAAYKKSVYEELGGFVTKTIFNEDMILAANIIEASYKILYAANAKVIHSHKYTYWEQFTRNFDLAVSHRQYDYIFSQVKSESEGIRLVKQTLSYLIKSHKVYLIPDLILQSGFKYLGYKTGLKYDRLPKKVLLKCSMNKSYWKKEK